MKRFVGALACLACLSAAPGAEAAALFTVTYEGTIYRSQGQTNLFIIAEEFPANGPAYKLVYTYDDRLGAHTIDDQPDRQLYQDNLSGEWAQNPVVSIKLTINSHSELITPADFPAHYNVGYHYVSDGPEQSALRVQSFLYGFSSDADYGGTYREVRVVATVFPQQRPPHGAALPFIGEANSLGGDMSFAWFRSHHLHGSADRDMQLGGAVERVTTAAIVPEPMTWALLILGFGGVGGALRRARVRLASG